MILINSAAYVVPELQLEYGKIPPSMLPLGNKRLFQHQLESVLEFSDGEDNIFISLPSDFLLSSFDRSILDGFNVTVIPIPPEFTLGQSLLYALNIIHAEQNNLYMLHGDTLISPIIRELDVIGIGTTQDNYDWQLESRDDSNETVWCGYFSFSDVQLLTQSLALKRGSFVDALEMYRERCGMNLVNVNAWYDLGHLNTYFKSRAEITTQRAFNELLISDGLVKKTGNPPYKISAEAAWFNNIPARLKKFTPQIIDNYQDSESSYYELEYLPLPPLNEVYVYGLNPTFFWNGIFSGVRNFMKTAEIELDNITKEMIQQDFYCLVENKTISRLEQYSVESNISLLDTYSYNGFALGSILDIVKECTGMIFDSGNHPAIIHGDLCFSNILYDSRSASLKMLDPRGMNAEGVATIYGDQKYDLAKLAHSVIGMYDFIISGRYQITEISDLNFLISFENELRIESIQRLFIKTEFITGYETSQILPLVILLFLSMLPLHNDRPDRQQAMLVNALRIYQSIKGERS